jgi:alkaline phosphatase D
VYPGADDVVPGRTIDPITEIVSLRDYYQRYATYHTDPDLLALRQLKPMTAVWDDHELTNNTWREGAQNHQPSSEGVFLDRMSAAAKAYLDWMPIRRPTPGDFRLYRHLDWGDLARVLLLDTRFIGRDEQLSYGAAFNQRLAQGGAEANAAVTELQANVLNDPTRTLLGGAQEAWFAETLARSKANGQVWQIVAQQVVMGEQVAPDGVTGFLPEGVSSGARTYFAVGERLGAYGLPWNLDSWGGYPAARQRALDACTANANNAIVLGGDSHNCWVNNLPGPQGRLAAIEFAGGSVSSPGFERSLSNAAAGAREALMRSANPALAWCDVSRRGYGALRFTHEACDAEWIAFADVTSPHAGAPMVTRMSSAASTNAGPGAWNVQAGP